MALVDIERDHIDTVLDRVKWRISGIGGAAELLRMHPNTLESRMTKLKIQRPRSLREEASFVHHVMTAARRVFTGLSVARLSDQSRSSG